MKHLDLFSGIGGFALAAEWVWGDDHEVLAFCDIDKYATKVLNRHWPDVPVIDDVRKINKEMFNGTTVDILTGGFPCQPFSQAGKRKGKDDDRYLWPEMLRIIADVRPRWVVGENVSGIYSIEQGMVFEQVCADLEAAGYEVWPLRIPASAVNAPHRRDRWWFVAYDSSEQDNTKHPRPERPSKVGRDSVGAGEQTARQTDGKTCHHGDSGRSADVAYGHRDGLDRSHSEHEELASERRIDALDDIAEDGGGKDAGWAWHWLEAAAQFCRVDDGLSDRMDTSDRKHRLKALGNAIVPQVAEQIFRAIKDADNGN